MTWSPVDEATLRCDVHGETFAKGVGQCLGCLADPALDDVPEALTEAERVCAEARSLGLPGRLALEAMLHTQRETAQRRSRKAWAFAMSIMPKDGEPLPMRADGDGSSRPDTTVIDAAGRFMSIAAKLQDVAIKATGRALDLVSQRERAAAVAEEQRQRDIVAGGDDHGRRRKPARAQG